VVEAIHIGNVEMLALPDGAANLGAHPMSPEDGPAPDWAPYHERFPDGFHGPDHHWRIHNTCYLVRSQGRSILVDTGVGVGPYARYQDMRGTLMGAMREAGVALEDVDAVMMTHAHPDHVGWNVDEETGRPRFPAARYLLGEPDWREYGGREPPPRYFQRFLQPLDDAGALDLLEGETAVTDEVTAMETPGHTPGHMSLLIASQGERLVIAGDVLTSPFYVSEPERPFFSDIDVQQAIGTRTALVARLEAEGMRVASPHFPAPGWGDVVRVEGRRWFRAL
jgi:glyoxylase-like metal-dependent hydrolase (beta-lactamase superfamily II)